MPNQGSAGGAKASPRKSQRENDEAGRSDTEIDPVGAGHGSRPSSELSNLNLTLTDFHDFTWNQVAKVLVLRVAVAAVFVGTFAAIALILSAVYPGGIPWQVWSMATALVLGVSAAGLVRDLIRESKPVADGPAEPGAGGAATDARGGRSRRRS